MAGTLNFVNLDSADQSHFEAFFKIYSGSIEKSEQKPKNLIEILSKRPDYLIRLVYFGDALAGFTLSYVNVEKKFSLLEYMAVDQKIRSQGLGSKLLADLIAKLAERHLDWMVLEVDSPQQKAPDQAARIRRVDFYRKNGCLVVEKFNYVLPLPSAPAQLEMKLMLSSINGKKVDHVQSTALREIVQDIYVNVYNCSSSDSRLSKMFLDKPEFLKLKR